ncbi:MAG: hypothetical protein MUC56_10865 [Thermoanaerobaculales bacterium]|nr:hypothetical protein [Thermoanaerobaculales bacterium]
MNRSKLLVALVVVLTIGIAAAAVVLRGGLRCAGFAGPGITPAELPPPPGSGRLRVASFNLRNFPLDERPEAPGSGFSRRTNICDLETALAGLGAQVMGFSEVCDTRRFPPILRRAGGGRPMRILFSADGGGAGQHLAVAWDGSALELVEGPIEIAGLVVKPGLRPGLAVRLRETAGSARDLLVVVVHLDAGRDDLEHRLEQVRALAAFVRGEVERTGDRDVVVVGDFNTVGGPGLEPLAELGLVDAILAGAGLERLANATGCSQYWEGPGEPDGVFRASLLDHVYLGGVRAAAPARSWLHCARLGCGELVSRPGAEDGTFFDVSDHCPVTFEVQAGEE